MLFSVVQSHNVLGLVVEERIRDALCNRLSCLNFLLMTFLILPFLFLFIFLISSLVFGRDNRRCFALKGGDVLLGSCCTPLEASVPLAVWITGPKYAISASLTARFLHQQQTRATLAKHKRF